MLQSSARTYLDDVVAMAVRSDFTAFKRFAWSSYQHQPHLALIDSYLKQVARYIETDGKEGIANLRIELPPRHGKTITCARLFPAWFLGRNPEKRVILASYGQSLATKNSRAVRSVVRQPRFSQVFGVSLAEDSHAKDAWDLATPHEGGLDSVGKGGALTGKGAHLIITDDLVKSRAEVESALTRERDWDWFTNDLLTRKQPGAAHISIMTRWHNDDIHGRLDIQQGEAWTKLVLPALAEENDPMGRQPGEALCPPWFDRQALLDTQAKIGEYPFGSLYQQAPTARTGGLFKRHNLQTIEYYQPTHRDRVVRFWDLALSERTSADYTVGVRMRWQPDGRWIVEDVQRVQKEWDQIPDFIEAVALRDGRSVPVGIETAFFQSRAVKALLKRESLMGYRIAGIAPDADKYTRALPFAARVGERMVHVLSRPWTQDYIDELLAFPLGGHDDQVDASSGAYTMLEKAPIQATTQRYA